MRRDENKNVQLSFLNPRVKIKLKMKMILLIGIFIVGLLVVIGLFSNYFVTDISKEQVGERALAVSESVAKIPELGAAFTEEHSAKIIQSIVSPIQEATGAEFIVVGNTEGIRYAHPDEQKIGQKMVGEDNERALLHGESYISEATGSLGTSLRAKTPIIVEGEIVGVVSVGFLVDDIQTIIQSYTKEIWLILGIIAIGAIFGAVILATYIKSLLFNLEPEEIASLYEQREKILQSAHEGIFAVDENGQITMMNASVEQLLGENESGKLVDAVIPNIRINRVLQNGVSVLNEEFIINGNYVFINVSPIQIEKKIIGAVATIKNKTEIEMLSKELAHVKQYSNALRAQTHEFSNKLHTMLGLLLLEKQDEAIEFIKQESDLHHDAVRSLMDHVKDPLVSGLLIGKINVANELKIEVKIDPSSQLQTVLTEKKNEVLLTAIGNIIDNAIDELRTKDERKIEIYFTDIGDDVVFEIEDSGRGIGDEMLSTIFTKGFSTKEGKDRGHGLTNVRDLLDDIYGTLYLEDGELGGACFIITVPKDDVLGGGIDK